MLSLRRDAYGLLVRVHVGGVLLQASTVLAASELGAA